MKTTIDCSRGGEKQVSTIAHLIHSHNPLPEIGIKNSSLLQQKKKGLEDLQMLAHSTWVTGIVRDDAS